MEKNSTSKRLLKAPLYQPLLVYEINGDTLVPAIMGDKSYDYVDLFYSSYYHEDWWFGHFSRNLCICKLFFVILLFLHIYNCTIYAVSFV